MADPNEACCTCAALLSPPIYTSISIHTEKPVSTPAPSSESSSPPRRLPCCSRAICAACLEQNPRFQTYCPFCQVSTEPSPLPQGLRDPPEYSSPKGSPRRRATDIKDELTSQRDGEREEEHEEPPPYTADNESRRPDAGDTQEEDVVHHLHSDDTIPSLSLAYRVPASILRTHNGLFSDSLLQARKSLLVPRAYYTGPSLSAEPVDSAEETERKAAVRRFMVGAKCHDYEMAELYLGQEGRDVEKAIERWRADERWERENPISGSSKEKGRKKRIGATGGLVGQLG